MKEKNMRLLSTFILVLCFGFLNGQSAVYLNLGHNFQYPTVGLAIGANVHDNIRLNFNGDFIRKTVENNNIGYFQLEPSVGFCIGSESVRPIIGIGGFYGVNLGGKSNEEIDTNIFDAGLSGYLGLTSNDVIVYMKYGKGLIDVFGGNKSEYYGLVISIPLMNPFE